MVFNIAPSFLRRYATFALPLAAMCLLAGCQQQATSLRTSDLRPRLGRDIARADVPEAELETGLYALFDQLALHLGPYPYVPVVKNYLPALREGLFYHGYAVVQRLNVNDATVDIIISFHSAAAPALVIEAFCDGMEHPIASVQNQYHFAQGPGEYTPAAAPALTPISTAPLSRSLTVSENTSARSGPYVR
jgi:hypothetical protein